MNFVQWYATSLGGLVAVLFLRRLRRLPITEVWTYIRLRIAYPLLIPRRHWWPSVTIMQAAVFGILVAINISLMASSDLTLRSGMLASVNIVLLFLGGRTSFLADFLGVPLHTYYLAHHWIGRMVVVQGLLHASLAVSSTTQARADRSGIMISISLALIFITSLYVIRRCGFQLFLYAHEFLALLTVGGLLWHLLPGISIKALFPALALTLWLLNTLGKFYRTCIRGKIERFEIAPLYSAPRASLTDVRITAIKLTFRSQSLLFGPGSFYYIRFWNQRLLDRFQSHPFLVAWWDTEEEESFKEYQRSKGEEEETDTGSGGEKEKERTKQSVTFLIRAQSGLSARLASSVAPQKAYLDGPYGQDLQLDRYETVILVADGIGIVGILPYAQHLTERRRHDNWIKRKVAETRKALKSAEVQYLAAISQARTKVDCEPSSRRIAKIKSELEKLSGKKLYKDLTRKVDLFWKMEENCQEEWVGNRLQKMQDDDFKKLLQIWCYYPYKQEKEPLFQINEGWKCFYPCDYILPNHIEKAIEDETRTPGRSIVVEFTQSMRLIVLGKMSRNNIIEFAEVEFQPRDTQSYPRPPHTPEIQPREIHDKDIQPKEVSMPLEFSKMSDSGDENSIKLKVVPSKRPVIHQPDDIMAQICVITKSEEHNRFENSVKMNIADWA